MAPRSLPALFLAAIALGVPARAAVLRQADRSEVDAVRVLRTLRDPHHPPIESLVGGFVRHSRSVPGFLFGILRDGKVPDLGEGEQVLSVDQRDLILAGFAKLGRSGTLSSLSAELAELDTVAERRAAVDVLGAIGREHDLERTLDLALRPQDAVLSRAMADATQRALTAILRRDTAGFRWLARSWRGAAPELLVPAILAVGEAQDPRGLEFLHELILAREELTLAAAAQIPRLGPSDDRSLNEDLAARLRELLDPADASRTRTLCQALGALEDLTAVPQLIELLASESRGLKAAAHAALKRATGLEFPADTLRWTHWLREERAWMTSEKDAAFRLLRSRDEGEVARAIHEIEAHPLARVELVDALEELLHSRSPSNQVQACAAAGRLERREIVRALIDALEDPSTEVVEAAHRALQKLTGFDLPDDPACWRERFPS
jgi:HEAT repeat protein